MKQHLGFLGIGLVLVGASLLAACGDDETTTGTTGTGSGGAGGNPTTSSSTSGTTTASSTSSSSSSTGTGGTITCDAEEAYGDLGALADATAIQAPQDSADPAGPQYYS